MTDMTDKKLTDEEIIKALEDYIKENEFEYFHSNMVGEYPLIRKSLDLINRQKAEIEELKNYINRCKSGKEHWVKCLLEKPNEAIKEFAERLKGEIKREKESGNELLPEIYDRDIQMNAEGEKTAYDNVERIVDNLLKEMVGE